MSKEKYKNHIQNLYDNVLGGIRGYHELGYILAFLSDYIDSCIQLCIDIYEDKDIDYDSYLELSKSINDSFKEVCRIIKNS